MGLYDEIQAEVAKKIQDITVDSIKKLINIWVECFERSSCEKYLRKLPDHVLTFYQEIINDSVQKRNSIVSDIEKLNEEVSNLFQLQQHDIDMSPKEDNGVPLETTSAKLDESFRDTLEEIEKYRIEMDKLLMEQQALCLELDEPCLKSQDVLFPAEKDVEALRVHLKGLKTEKATRMKEICNLREDIWKLLRKLEIRILNKEYANLLYDRYILPTRVNIYKLRKLREEFQQQFEELGKIIEKTKKRLEILWDCLETSPSVRKRFEDLNNCSQTTCDLLKNELVRCEKEKQQNIQRYATKLQENLDFWWGKTLKLDPKKADDFGITPNFKEDIIGRNESELEDLKKFYYDNEKLLNLISERIALWDRMIALEAKESDPNRFENRGGQLLKEVKEKAEITRKLPKIESKITELALNYERSKKRKFCVYGENILEIIARDWEKRRTEKEKQLSVRKRSPRTPLSADRQKLSPGENGSISYFLSWPPRKKKYPYAESICGGARRNLLNDLSQQKSMFRLLSKNAMQHETSLKKSRVIATTIRGESLRRVSFGGKSRKKTYAVNTLKIPKIIITKEDSEPESSFKECALHSPNLEKNSSEYSTPKGRIGSVAKGQS